MHSRAFGDALLILKVVRGGEVRRATKRTGARETLFGCFLGIEFGFAPLFSCTLLTQI